MNVGKLRHRVDIYKAVDTPDGGGGKTLTPKLLGRSWCKIEPANDYAIQTAARQKREITHKITMRFRKGLTAETWLQYQGRVFDIVSFKDIEERRVYLLITAKERAA